MNVIPLSSVTQDQISNAFERFHQNREGKAVGYLTEKGITQFHCDKMIGLLDDAKQNSSIQVVMDHNDILAIFGLSKSAWHEEIYGVPYFKISPYYVFQDEPAICREIVKECIKRFDAEGSVYTMRVDSYQHHLAYELTRQGFVFVGTSMRYNLGDGKFKHHPLLDRKTNSSLTIRDYDAKDLNAVQKIAKTGHRHSHFFQEARFPAVKTQELFAGWIKKCAEGKSAKIWVAEHEGKITGFANCLLNNGLQQYIQKRIGIIDFIVVDSSAQGMGVGRDLLAHTLKWFQDQVEDVELRTMADNVRAVRFYEANGFRVLSSDHHLHLWK